MIVLSIGRSSMSGGTRGHSFTGLFAPPKCAASGRVIQAGCQLWMIKIIGSPTRPCSGSATPDFRNICLVSKLEVVKVVQKLHKKHAAGLASVHHCQSKSPLDSMQLFDERVVL